MPPTQAKNRLRELTALGQSLWLDFTRRSFVAGGELRRLIDEDGLSGVTSNPTIFDQAINQGTEYDGDIARAAKQGLSAEETYEEIAITDIRAVADEFRGVYGETRGGDGYVSLEVSPHLAHDTAGSLAQARDFWVRVGRPNLFVKIPATDEGLPAIRRLIAEGINVNVTLLFGIERYRAVAEAYIAGLEDRDAAGKPLDQVASVASFFLSRIDLMVDPMLEAAAKKGGAEAERARSLHGQAAIACAKEAYQAYKEIFGSDRFQRLAYRRARPQKVLWASTSTKRKEERDVRYVEALIGPETVDTMPKETLEAFRDHGEAAPRLEEGVDEARAVLRGLGAAGIDMAEVSRRLEAEGLDKFNKTFDHLHGELERKLRSAGRP